MMQSQSQSKLNQIKLNWRGLLELVLMCAFLSLLTLAVWSWQTKGGYVAAMDVRAAMAGSESQASLMVQILRHPAIMLSTVAAEFFLLLAFVLALVPPVWWLRADHLFGSDPATTATPLRWLGEKVQQIGHQTTAKEGQVAVNEAGEPIYYEHPGVTGMEANQFSGMPAQQAGAPVPGQPVPGQAQPGQPLPGQPAPGQMQQGQMQQGQPLPGQSAPGQAQPGQPTPGQPVDGQTANAQGSTPAQANTANPATPPLEEVLNFDEEEDDDPLADLANIKDILSSAFDEDAGVDPDLEALARSLDEVSIVAIRTTADEIAATFRQ